MARLIKPNVLAAEEALAHLIAARDAFKTLDNKRTVERIRSAISSARGAVRVQEYRRARAITERIKQHRSK